MSDNDDPEFAAGIRREIGGGAIAVDSAWQSVESRIQRIHRRRRALQGVSLILLLGAVGLVATQYSGDGDRSVVAGQQEAPSTDGSSSEQEAGGETWTSRPERRGTVSELIEDGLVRRSDTDAGANLAFRLPDRTDIELLVDQSLLEAVLSHQVAMRVAVACQTDCGYAEAVVTYGGLGDDFRPTGQITREDGLTVWTGDYGGLEYMVYDTENWTARVALSGVPADQQQYWANKLTFEDDANGWPLTSMAGDLIGSPQPTEWAAMEIYIDGNYALLQKAACEHASSQAPIETPLDDGTSTRAYASQCFDDVGILLTLDGLPDAVARMYDGMSVA